MSRRRAMPHVSVVIPAHNAQAFVARAARSVFEQSFRDFELLVVDDGSSDATAEILSALLANDARLKVHSIRHGGVELARNYGVAKSAGEWVAFLDADDYWEPDKLQRQVEFLAANSDVVLTSTYGRYFGTRGNRIGTLEYGPTSEAQLTRKRKQCRPIGMLTPSVLCKRAVLLELGGFNPEFRGAAEDLDLWTRIAYRYPVLTLPEHLVNVSIAPGGASLQKWYLIQEHIRWIELNIPRLVDHRPLLSREHFQNWLGSVDERTRREWECEWQCGFWYRKAGHDLLEGNTGSALANLGRSFMIHPRLTLRKLRGHRARSMRLRMNRADHNLESRR